MGPQSVFLLIMLVAIGIGLAHWRTRMKNMTDAWGAIARGHGLRMTPGSMLKGPRLGGRYKGHRISVHTVTRGGSKNRRTYTRFEMAFDKDLGLGLRLESESAFSGVAKFFGAQDIQVGDAGFDNQVVVKGRDAEGIRAFLTPARRFHCLRFLTRNGRRSIHDRGVDIEIRGVVTDEMHVRAMLAAMATVTDQLVGDGPPSLSQAIDAQADGGLDEALESVRALPTDRVNDNPDWKVLEGEILYTGGRYDEAADSFGEARAADPSDVEAAAWHDQASARAKGQQPPPLPPELAAPDPEPVAPVAAGGTDLDTVCATLFGPGVSSLQASRAFEERFENSAVQWKGKLERANRASFDLVFGNTPFTKTIVELVEYGDGLASRMIRAVVQFPEDMEESLRALQGQAVTFKGRLVRCDSFMRNLFVADGELVS